MKLNTLGFTAVVVLMLSSCGEIPTEFAVDVQSSDDSFVAALTEDVEDVNEESGAEVDENGTPPAEVIVLHQLGQQMLLEMADCAGFGEEARALATKKKELRESGVSREEAKEQLQVEHEALREAAKSSRDSIGQCKESLKESETRQIHQAAVEACFEAPKRGERKKRNSAMRLFRKGDHKGKEGRKGKKGGMFRLPPKEFAQFDSEGCQAAIAEGEKSLLGLEE